MTLQCNSEQRVSIREGRVEITRLGSLVCLEFCSTRSQSTTQHSADELAVHCNASRDVTPHGIFKDLKAIVHHCYYRMQAPLQIQPRYTLDTTLHILRLQGLALGFMLHALGSCGYCPVGIGSYKVKSIVADGSSLTGLRAGELASKFDQRNLLDIFQPCACLLAPIFNHAHACLHAFLNHAHACLHPSSITRLS